jgi:hypothetical protein
MVEFYLRVDLRDWFQLPHSAPIDFSASPEAESVLFPSRIEDHFEASWTDSCGRWGMHPDDCSATDDRMQTIPLMREKSGIDTRDGVKAGRGRLPGSVTINWNQVGGHTAFRSSNAHGVQEIEVSFVDGNRSCQITPQLWNPLPDADPVDGNKYRLQWPRKKVPR